MALITSDCAHRYEAGSMCELNRIASAGAALGTELVALGAGSASPESVFVQITQAAAPAAELSAAGTVGAALELAREHSTGWKAVSAPQSVQQMYTWTAFNMMALITSGCG